VRLQLPRLPCYSTGEAFELALHIPQGCAGGRVRHACKGGRRRLGVGTAAGVKNRQKGQEGLGYRHHLTVHGAPPVLWDPCGVVQPGSPPARCPCPLGEGKAAQGQQQHAHQQQPAARKGFTDSASAGDLSQVSNRHKVREDHLLRVMIDPGSDPKPARQAAIG
jgi:hypothetical protein